MKNKQWIFEIVLFILWTTAFVGTLIGGNIGVLDYVLLYIAFFCEILKNFLINTQGKFKKNKTVTTETEEENNEH